MHRYSLLEVPLQNAIPVIMLLLILKTTMLLLQRRLNGPPIPRHQINHRKSRQKWCSCFLEKRRHLQCKWHQQQSLKIWQWWLQNYIGIIQLHRIRKNLTLAQTISAFVPTQHTNKLAKTITKHSPNKPCEGKIIFTFFTEVF